MSGRFVHHRTSAYYEYYQPNQRRNLYNHFQAADPVNPLQQNIQPSMDQILAIDYLNHQLRMDMRVNATPRHQRAKVVNNQIPASIGSLDGDNLDRLLANMDQIINDESGYERTRERYQQGGYEYFQNLPYQQQQSEFSKSITRRMKKLKETQNFQEIPSQLPSTTTSLESTTNSLQAVSKETEDPAIVWMGQKTKDMTLESDEDVANAAFEYLLKASQEVVKVPQSGLQYQEVKVQKDAKELDLQEKKSLRTSPILLDVEKHFENLTKILEEKAEEIILDDNLKKFDFVFDDQEEISKFEKENSISTGIKKGIIDKLIWTNERQLMNLAKIYIKCGQHDTAEILKEFSPENLEKMYAAAQQMAQSMNMDQEIGHSYTETGHSYTETGHSYNETGHNYIYEKAQIYTETGQDNVVNDNAYIETGHNDSGIGHNDTETGHNTTKPAHNDTESGHNDTESGHTYKDQEDETPEEDLEIFENLYKSMNGEQPEEESYKVIEEMMAHWKRIEREEEVRRLLKQKREVELRLEKLTQAHL